MINKLVVIINNLKVPKIKKILLYEMKFLLPYYSCLQNPWLEGYQPQIPVLSVLNWICWTSPPRTKFLGTPLSYPGLLCPKGKNSGIHRTVVIAQSLLQLGCGQDNQKTRQRQQIFSCPPHLGQLCILLDWDCRFLPQGKRLDPEAVHLLHLVLRLTGKVT